ncbi:MAG: hypothetical protein DI536_26985 [Archangium gephyra]|uniref:Lipoprotein n=1 Tax=Archangium gephyra TaxID=48 RepID=A0A2W5VBH4_9BACT|nr:MAG: hypothetical protein DI536_26985 [Archangium gephyra]
MSSRLFTLLLLLTSCAGELRLGSRDGGSTGACGCEATQRCLEGRCVDCTANSECAGGLCDVERGRCMVACTEDSQCDSQLYPRECRDEFGPDRCVACRDPDDCSGARSICAGGLCVACDADAHCASGRCDRSRGSCTSG